MIGEEIRRPFPRKLGGFGIVIGSGFVEEGMPRFVPVGFERHLAFAQLGFQCPGLLGRKRFTERLFRALEVGSDGAMNPSASPMVREMIQEARARERRALRQARMEGAEGQSFGMRFDAEAWLKPLGAWPDREPDGETRARIATAVLAAPAVNPVPAGTVGLSYLRLLSLDPAFQLK